MFTWKTEKEMARGWNSLRMVSNDKTLVFAALNLWDLPPQCLFNVFSPSPALEGNIKGPKDKTA
jgi:hypothetical protein